MLERLISIKTRICREIYISPAKELEEFASKVLRGEIPDFAEGGKKVQLIDFYGDRARFRIPWGKDGLEKSFHAVVHPDTGQVYYKCEGFFMSDKHDWSKNTDFGS
ncbi:MAG: hypothetical protein M1268_00155 [Patescibacteria group bacterium]|nr:hypothetical protein [Patescibacteria group bacterium]